MKIFSKFEIYAYELNINFLNIMSINVRSVSSLDKFNKFKTLVASFPKLPDIIAIQETWFKNEITQLYTIPGFECIHCCRDDGYGGTSLYINRDIQYTVEICKSANFVEIINVRLCNFKIDNRPMKLISFYRSQKCNVSDFINMFDVLLNNHAQGPMIVVGDANIDLFQSLCCVDYCSMFQNYDCESAHSLITRPASGTCIDHVFSNISGRLSIDSVECALSDHNMLCCRVGESASVGRYLESTKVYCDYFKAKQILCETLPADCFPFTAASLTDEVISCVQSAVGQSTIVTKCRKEIRFGLQPWIGKNLQGLILLKERLLRRRRRSKDRQNIDESLGRISKVIRFAIRDCRSSYYADSLRKVGNDPKKSWNFINETLGRKKKDVIKLRDSQGDLVGCDQIKADTFNNYFISSIADLKRQMVVQPGDTFNFFRTLSQSRHRFKIDIVELQCIKDVIMDMKIDKSPGNDMISPKFVRECVDEIAPSLMEIFNKMIVSSVYPDILKIHKIVPIPKESNASTEDKYRPISILSTIDKVFEKILFDKLLLYFEENNLLYDLQFGFRRGCGTEDAVLNVVRFICKGLDEGFSGVAGLFFDFTKAFDLVDHEILLRKLELYGVQGSELLLFRSYFANRKQFVQINEFRSFMGSVRYGVPQGSGLGPLLFSIYLNDLRNLGLTGQLYMFADDICLFYPYKYDLVLKTQIERDVSLLFEFARINGLLLNPNKTKMVRFRPRSANVNHDFGVYMDGKYIEETHSVKYLGIILQSNLSWDLHIDELKRKTAPAVGVLYKLRRRLNEKAKGMIFQSLIQSHINYLAITYAYKRNNSSLKSLQRVQSKALKIVYDLPITFPTNLLYTIVARNILPVYGIHEYQVLMFVYKCIHNIGHHTIPFAQNQANFNTRNQSDLRVPRCRLEKTKQRVDYVGGVKYNELPSYLKELEIISRFKYSCKEYLSSNVENLIL